MGELTPREKEVGDLVMMGLTYKAIAEELKISRSMVNYHVQRMLERFKIHCCKHPRVALAAALSRKT